MADFVVGTDFGGTHARSAAVGMDGYVFGYQKASADISRGQADALKALVKNINSVIEVARSEGHSLKAIGVGMAGPILMDRGIIVEPPNLHEWDGFNIREQLAPLFEVPLFYDNDANAATLGEMWLGVAKGVKNFCLLTFGTGVGGGVVIDGKIMHGNDGMAAELGHITVSPDGPKCMCGSNGCLESYVSATGIRRIAQQMIEEGGRGDMAEKYKNILSELTSEIIYNYACNKDEVALETLRKAGYYLGIGISILMNAFNPGMIVLGGGAGPAWKFMKDEAWKQIQKRTYKFAQKRIKIIPSGLGERAGVIGAAYIAWRGIGVFGTKGNPHSGSNTPLQKATPPWGKWETLYEADGYKIKRFEVNPGHRLSYQKHKHRSERWTVARGEATVILNDVEYNLKVGENIEIPKEALHRVENRAEEPCVIVEVQLGDYLGEDDIVRVSDDYGREDKK